MSEITVIKETGETEEFNKQKILKSLKGSGASTKDAEDAVRKISFSAEPEITTKEIFKMASRHLQGCDVPSRMRYSLKHAIYALGPSGYPFEKYISRIFEADGYEVQVGIIMKGFCVRHEVDVVARNEKEYYTIECKFHHNGKLRSDVKTAMYVNSRFHDLNRAHKASSRGSRIKHSGLLVTNTKFSSEAIKYARCTGLKTMGWKYPRGGSLEQMIDRQKTYPVTVLPGANRRVLNALFRKDIILASDVHGMDAEELIALTGLDSRTVIRLKSQTRGICG